MRLWLVSREQWDYDEYDAFVIRAPSAEAALEIARGKQTEKQRSHLGVEEDWKFTAMEVVPDGEPGIVLDSFNAG